MTEQTNEITFEDLHELPEVGELISDAEVDTPEQAAVRKALGSADSKSKIARYEEKCTACSNGTFVSYAGRPVGPCFKCKGTGTRVFKTSPEQRQSARDRSVRKKELRKEEKLAAMVQYKEEHAELIAYLEDVSGWNKFAATMLNTISDFGALSPNQFAAVEKMYAKHLAKQEGNENAPTSGIDLTNIPAGTYAVPNSDTRLKVAIRKPGKNSKWHGYIFVDDGAEYGNRNNYGRQVPGKDYEGKIHDELKAIIVDPLEAMKAYGRLVGRCGACGRLLEDETSILNGIGPICANKF